MYAYEKLMSDNNLSKDELPADAITGIRSIQQIANAMKMTEKRGQTVSQNVKDKLKANDKWVVREILDHLEDTDNNSADLPNPAIEVVDSLNEKAPPAAPAPDPKGIKIDNELANLYEKGDDYHFQFTIEELRDLAKTTYQTIFSTYNESEKNGVITSNFSLLEENTEVFKLQKI
tara:strand:+ start:3805 stop:4329 length:525 start_codon:yes stop_codon:yes gene_type:complete